MQFFSLDASLESSCNAIHLEMHTLEDGRIRLQHSIAINLMEGKCAIATMPRQKMHSEENFN